MSAFLARLGLAEAPRGFGQGLRLAYHDACHLANAQGVQIEPRTLLRSIPGVDLCELPSPELCCGSGAGTYNLEQPVIAASLGAKKAQAVIATGASVVGHRQYRLSDAAANAPGQTGSPIRVRHTMQVLRDGYTA